MGGRYTVGFYDQLMCRKQRTGAMRMIYTKKGLDTIRLRRLPLFLLN